MPAKLVLPVRRGVRDRKARREPPERRGFRDLRAKGAKRVKSVLRVQKARPVQPDPRAHRVLQAT